MLSNDIGGRPYRVYVTSVGFLDADYSADGPLRACSVMPPETVVRWDFGRQLTNIDRKSAQVCAVYHYLEGASFFKTTTKFAKTATEE